MEERADAVAAEHTTLALLLEHNTDAVLQSLRSTPGAPASPMSALIAARTVADVIEDVTRVLVAEARHSGRTWSELGQLLRISRQAAQQRFGADPVDALSSEFAALARRSSEIIEQIRTADWDAVRADWDDTMRAKLPVEDLTQVWAQVTRNAGMLQTVGRPSLVRKGPYRIADIALAFERGPMKARVTFNHDDTVAGLFILLPDTL